VERADWVDHAPKSPAIRGMPGNGMLGNVGSSKGNRLPKGKTVLVIALLSIVCWLVLISFVLWVIIPALSD
jgi:hypothetical protein